MSKEQRFKERNNFVRQLFYDIQKKNPKWRIECVIEEVAKKVFLAERTVEAIIGYEGIYGDASKQKTNLNQTSLF